MLHYFKKEKNTNEMQTKICAVYGEGVVTDGTWQKWFAKFLGATDFFEQLSLCYRAVLCIGRCLAAPLASTH